MTEKKYKRLHAKVRSALKKAHNTRSIPAIALDTEISDGALRRIENGDTLRPRASTLEMLAKYFEMDDK